MSRCRLPVEQPACLRPFYPACLIGLVALAFHPSATTAEPQEMPSNATAHPELWPEAHSTGLVDDKTEAFITDLMSKMSLREKVGQMIQGDMEATTPE